MKKVGILGSGVVAQTLGAGFLKKGYAVKLGTRSAEKLDAWKAGAGAGAEVGTPAQAAAFGDLLVLAVKGDAALAALEAAGPEHLEGKLLLDATNPISPEPPQGGVLRFFTNLDQSLMERLQEAYPGVRFVKAFNCIGSAFMVDPDFGGEKPAMFLCGNDESAKREAAAIVASFGFEPEDMGPVQAARALEPLCMLWCLPGFLRNQWSHAFRLLKK